MAEAKAIMGREDWLFLDQDANHVQAQITGKFILDQNFEKNWENVGAYRQAAFATRNVPYLFLIAPNKECVYSEYLPEGTSLSPMRPVSKVMSALENKIKVLYPLDTLKEHRNFRETYPKGDTHWNQYGSFIAYKVLMSSLGISSMTDDNVEFYSKKFNGDLSSKIGKETDYIFINIKRDRSKITHNDYVKNIGNLLIWENEDQSLPKLVLFRDSFSTSLLTMIAQHFSRFVAVWQPNIDYELIDREKPD